MPFVLLLATFLHDQENRISHCAGCSVVFLLPQEDCLNCSEAQVFARGSLQVEATAEALVQTLWSTQPPLLRACAPEQRCRTTLSAKHIELEISQLKRCTQQTDLWGPIWNVLASQWCKSLTRAQSQFIPMLKFKCYFNVDIACLATKRMEHSLFFLHAQTYGWSQRHQTCTSLYATMPNSTERKTSEPFPTLFCLTHQKCFAANIFCGLGDTVAFVRKELQMNPNLFKRKTHLSQMTFAVSVLSPVWFFFLYLMSALGTLNSASECSPGHYCRETSD